MLRRLATVAGTIAAVTAIALAGLASPAAAMTRWFGATHVTVNTSTQYGGWVDGNGPDSYMAWADCKNGSIATGAERWAGDRNGSVATCSSGIISGASHRGFFLIDK